MNTPSLRDIVTGLLLGEVCNVARHGRCDDERASLALLEVVADSLGAVEGSVQVGLDDLHPVVDSAVEDT